MDAGNGSGSGSGSGSGGLPPGKGDPNGENNRDGSSSSRSRNNGGVVGDVFGADDQFVTVFMLLAVLAYLLNYGTSRCTC